MTTSPWHGRTIRQLVAEVIDGRLTADQAEQIRAAHRQMRPKDAPADWSTFDDLLIDDEQVT